MHLQSTGDYERKRARALDLTRKVLTLRSFYYSPFWEDIHEQWVHVFAPKCTLGEAIAELLATIEDLIVGAEHGECTTAGLHFAIECFNDLVDAYDLHDGPHNPWKTELHDLVATLDRTTSLPEAAALVRRSLPRLRRRLAHAHQNAGGSKPRLEPNGVRKFRGEHRGR